MNLLVGIATKALEAYPIPLAQDILDLTDEVAYSKFSNRRHAKVQVRGEKEVLQHFLTWARTALDVLDIIEAELMTNSEECRKGLDGALEGGSARRTTAPGFDAVVRAMEENEGDFECSTAGGTGGVIGGRAFHHTIVRYCADVLGSLRREEFKSQRMEKMIILSGR